MRPTRFFRAAVLASLTSLLVAGAADSSPASGTAVPPDSGRRLLAQERSGTVDPELLAGVKARSIGPAGMSGRVTAIDVVHSDPKTIYVGAASGGVWKTEDAGMTWTPVFDDQPVHSIGDIEIFQASPDVVWVGTGEGNPRNSISVGNGIYKSIDGGQTWEHLGLEKTEHIHRIVLHPTDPDR